MTRPTRRSLEQRVVREADKYLEDFPPYYDALKDGLADRNEHAITVNELLRHLRACVALARRKK